MKEGAKLDGQSHYVTKSALMVPMGMTVYKNVAVTVFTTLHVTKRLVSVTGGVIQDILTPIAAENVILDILDWIVVIIVAAIV